MPKLQNNAITYQSHVSRLITSFFGQFRVLVGKPLYKMHMNKTKFVVEIPYFVPITNKLIRNIKSKPYLIPVTDSQLCLLASAITELCNPVEHLNVPVNVEVRFIRLRYPYLDSAVLSQYLALNAGKYNYTRMQKRVFNKVPILSTISGLTNADHKSLYNGLPSYVTGAELELAGRLTTQRTVPRKTVDNTHTGSFTAPSSLIDFSQYASKNKLGAFTIKV